MKTKLCTNCEFRMSEIAHKTYVCTNSFCKVQHECVVDMNKKEIKERLAYLRGEIDKECISYGEIFELQALAQYIDSEDVVLLEWAGVPEVSL